MEKLALPYQIARMSSASVNENEEIVANLVHELTQPLTAINLYISRCICRLANDVEGQELILQAMKKVIQNIECAEEIILRMKNYIGNIDTNS